MAPRIAAGPGGSLMVTYYEWAMLWGSSRDRNIFARRYEIVEPDLPAEPQLAGVVAEPAEPSYQPGFGRQPTV